MPAADALGLKIRLTKWEEECLKHHHLHQLCGKKNLPASRCSPRNLAQTTCLFFFYFIFNLFFLSGKHLASRMQMRAGSGAARCRCGQNHLAAGRARCWLELRRRGAGILCIFFFGSFSVCLTANPQLRFILQQLCPVWRRWQDL